MDDPPRFIADVMLGRLARWLRLLGFDTLYDRRAADRELARLAAREGRIVLTRDRGLLRRRLVTRGLLVESGELGAQLRQVVAAFGLPCDSRQLFSRCVTCNGVLEPVDHDAVQGRVPPFVARTHDAFLACAGCGRIFWVGTHHELARTQLARLLRNPDEKEGGALDEPPCAP